MRLDKQGHVLATAVHAAPSTLATDSAMYYPCPWAESRVQRLCRREPLDKERSLAVPADRDEPMLAIR